MNGSSLEVTRVHVGGGIFDRHFIGDGLRHWTAKVAMRIRLFLDTVSFTYVYIARVKLIRLHAGNHRKVQPVDAIKNTFHRIRTSFTTL